MIFRLALVYVSVDVRIGTYVQDVELAISKGVSVNKLQHYSSLEQVQFMTCIEYL
jgi:hypothetical protein